MAAVLAVAVTATIVLTGSVTSPASARGWQPTPGVRTNDPLGTKAQRRTIVTQVVRAIDHARPGSQIRVASWNIRSREVVNALVRAHRRDVGVRVVMDRLNANPDNPNRVVDRLERVLARRHNADRPPSLRSGLTKCVSACRGPDGIAHSKFFLFERTGSARFVVMNGSWNATDLASSGQWNDLYTVNGSRGLYGEFSTVFDQMYADTDVAGSYRVRRVHARRASFFPFRTDDTARDPVLSQLRPVRCHGARNTNGNTKIRIAMTAWFGPRGIAIAHRIRRLENAGCDIRIVYAVMGNEVLRVLRRGGQSPVPLRQIVQDFDRDGIYDRYLHMKVMTIKGHYGRGRRTSVTFNGSANWSPAALASDEAVLRIKGAGTVRRYNARIDHLFRNPPR